jgi:hypothetical protein
MSVPTPPSCSLDAAGDVLGGTELGRPDRPAGSVSYPYFHERGRPPVSNRSHLVVEEAKEEVQS